MQYTPETLAGMTEAELADHYFSAIEIDDCTGSERKALDAMEAEMKRRGLTMADLAKALPEVIG